MSERRQIVAMGGGGFSMEPENMALDRWLLGLTGMARPRVCFMPTASGDAQGYIDNFYKAFGGLECVASHLGLFRREVEELRPFLLSQDVIYVGGGNTANMLAIWRVHGVDVILREAWEAGVILAGLSAGSLCWFEGGVTDSLGTSLRPMRDGLGLLSGSNCPHYDGEAQRRPVYQAAVASGALEAGYGADDGVALRYVGAELVEVVSEREGASAWRVSAVEGGGVLEERVEARRL